MIANPKEPMMNRALDPRRTTLMLLSALVLFGGASLSARAQDDLILLETARTTMYLNGGVGKDDEAYMRRIAKDWPLRMTFSERRDNEFVADVRVAVTDARGAPVLLLNDAGPMTYAMLPAGKYRVSATFHGITESREVTIDGAKGRDVAFHWQGRPKVDPWDGRPVGGKPVSG